MLLLHRPVEIKPCAQTVSREAHEIDTGTFRRAASLDVPVSASIGLPETVCAQGCAHTSRRDALPACLGKAYRGRHRNRGDAERAPPRTRLSAELG